ncbi:hypothetical protein SAMN05216311_11164 [Chitinophaga sp. CF418]|nr:hypothetical protein SAMN05216311_11164 [Chitinophaga sp. CF418]
MSYRKNNRNDRLEDLSGLFYVFAFDPFPIRMSMQTCFPVSGIPRFPVPGVITPGCKHVAPGGADWSE